MEKKTDISKVFGKMPEAKELLPQDGMEKEQLRKEYNGESFPVMPGSYAAFLEEKLIKQFSLLYDLYDLQNGPPLIKYENDWNETMKNIDEHLSKYQ